MRDLVLDVCRITYVVANISAKVKILNRCMAIIAAAWNEIKRFSTESVILGIDWKLENILEFRRRDCRNNGINLYWPFGFYQVLACCG